VFGLVFPSAGEGGGGRLPYLKDGDVRRTF